MKPKAPQLPQHDVDHYWRTVRAILILGGMTPEDAEDATAAYRKFIKPAGWTVYNDDPHNTAAMARLLAAQPA